VTDDSPIHPKALDPLTGEESVCGEATVLDFWRWGFGDLRMNVVRGVLAEFFVAQAVGDTTTPRHAWADCDVVTPSGVKIEVKAAAYLQSWTQRRLSRVSFSGLWGYRWNEGEVRYETDQEVLADVIVFAVQTCTDPNLYDPLDIAQWTFYVMPADVIRLNGLTGSIGLRFVEANAERCTSAEIAKQIEAIGRAV
jgi:hypothetical protein